MDGALAKKLFPYLATYPDGNGCLCVGPESKHIVTRLALAANPL